MRREFLPSRVVHSDGLTLAVATWLASGLVLLGLTPLPLHDPRWGWSPVFWLVLTPALMLAVRCVSARKPVVRKARIASGRPRRSDGYRTSMHVQPRRMRDGAARRQAKLARSRRSI